MKLALALTGKGATTILACRNLEKAEAAKNKILEIHKQGKIEVRQIDTSSLRSVRHFAGQILQAWTHELDLGKRLWDLSEEMTGIKYEL